jgi:hypothetical protein
VKVSETGGSVSVPGAHCSAIATSDEALPDDLGVNQMDGSHPISD